MNIEQVVYGTKGNEMYLTLVMKKVETADYYSTLEMKPAIYKLYDKEDNLVYIGETKILRKRITSHFSKQKNRKVRFTKEDIAYIEYAYVDLDRYSRSIVEGILVDKYKPVFNCEDENMLFSRTSYSMEFLMDIQFYLRNTNIRTPILASAFGIESHAINYIKNSGTGNELEIPADYVPNVLITEEFIKNHTQTSKHITKEEFFKIREKLENNTPKTKLAKEFKCDISTVARIAKLTTQKFKKWEQERVKEVA